MPLLPGTRLGPYEITGSLGAGGMGEVYRARDPRLDRDVAVKVLAQDVAADGMWRQRFAREARAASALSHPNIATIYDYGEQDGRGYIVMEHVDGETLASRILDRPLPTRDIVDLAIQVAGALEEAHAHRIVHRDIKPANIMVTRRAQVKVLDFGVARVDNRASADVPTTTVLTRPETVLGTLPYMSPEQILGMDVDARSDLFSFGAVLYEMATGRRAFAGGTAAETTDLILHHNPPAIARLNYDVPQELERVVLKCLEKDPARRYQTTTELVVDFERLKRDLEMHDSDEALPRRPKPRFAPWPVLVAIGIAAVFALSRAPSLFRRDAPAAPIVLDVVPPEGVALSNSIALSPDGKYLAYTAAGEDGKSSVWLRSIGSEDDRRLEMTTGAVYPFWSPDSRSLGFFADGKLKRVDLGGGPARSLAEAPAPRGGTWGANNTIVYGPTGGTVLYRISADRGDAVPITMLDSTRNEADHRWPVFLPDGTHVLFMARSNNPESNPDSVAIAAVNGAQTPHRILTSAASSAFYLDGHLFFVRGRTLMMQPFDINRLDFRASVPTAVRTDVWRFYGLMGLHSCTGAATSLIACRVGATATRLAWVDRTGAVLGVVDANYTGNPELSPDTKLLAFAVLNEDLSHDVLAVFDFTSGTTQPLTQLNVESELWSPHGDSIVFTGEANGTFDLFSRPVAASAPEQLLLHTDGWKTLMDWSRDGKWLLYGENQQLYALSLLDKHIVRIPCPDVGPNARLSPDGQWIAFSSRPAAGVSDIFVCPFPRGGERRRVSNGGGTEPRWRRDGRELYFVSGDRRIMAVDVARAGDTIRFTNQRALFDRRTYDSGYSYSYDVAPGGDRFLLATRRERGRIAVMANWHPQ